MSVTDLTYPGKVAVQQRVLPAYRAPFFDMLASRCEGGLSVYAGQPLPGENIKPAPGLTIATHYQGTNRHTFSPGSPLYRCDQPDILAWLAGWDPDVLIIEANTRYPSSKRAIHWMHQRLRPVIGWGLGAPTAGGLLGTWITRRRKHFLSSLDGIIAYSTKGMSEYLALGMPQDRVHVAVNASSPSPAQPPPDRTRPEGQPKNVLFVGRLQERKRVDNLLRACSDLPGSLQPNLWIIGDGPAAADLKQLAAQVYPAAQFPGAVHGQELEAYFIEADLFVLPGTGGLAVQQAMGYGLPVIVAQGDGTQADLVSPENGWLIPNDDLHALRNALQEALSNPEQLTRRGDASYRVVRDEVNLENMVSGFIHAMINTKVRGVYERGGGG